MLLKDYLGRYSLEQLLSLLVEEYVGFLMRYLPSYEGMLLRWWMSKITFKKIGWHPLIWPNVYITHSYNIVAGKRLCINNGAHIDGRGGVEIGDHVLVGPGTFIGSSNHVTVSSLEAPRLMLGHVSKPVKIGSNVWLGAHVVVCPGVTIGNNSIVAAGSVVVKDIPESVLAAGIPAVVMKSL